MSEVRISVDELCEVLQIRPVQLQIFNPAYPDVQAQRELLVLHSEFGAAREIIEKRYHSDAMAKAVLPGFKVRPYTRDSLPSQALAWFLLPLKPEEDTYSLESFRKVIEFLFSPEGCPWDNAQTANTLKKYLIEETYELVDAIEKGDSDSMLEEIGDVLAHMFMQTSVATKNHQFNLEDVVSYANKKYVRRHPHVFSDKSLNQTEESLKDSWEEIKATERKEKELTGAVFEGVLESIPSAMPSLSRAQLTIRRSRKAGALIPDLQEQDRSAQTILNFLLKAVILAEKSNLDAEELLRHNISAYAEEFKKIERDTNQDIANSPDTTRVLPWLKIFTDQE